MKESNLIYILNGPNLNLLGVREPEIYGKTSYTDLCAAITEHVKARGAKCVIRQSNHEGDLVDWIQEAYFKGARAIVLNAAAYTHTSIALLDAVKAVPIPVAEVHLSDLSLREDFRQVSYLRSACAFSVMGKGIDGYLEAIDFFLAPAK